MASKPVRARRTRRPDAVSCRSRVSRTPSSHAATSTCSGSSDWVGTTTGTVSRVRDSDTFGVAARMRRTRSKNYAGRVSGTPAEVGHMPTARTHASGEQTTGALEGANLGTCNVVPRPEHVRVAHISDDVVRSGRYGAIDGKPVLVSAGRHARSPPASDVWGERSQRPARTSLAFGGAGRSALASAARGRRDPVRRARRGEALIHCAYPAGGPSWLL
jgi:hypothetical protein